MSAAANFANNLCREARSRRDIPPISIRAQIGDVPEERVDQIPVSCVNRDAVKAQAIGGFATLREGFNHMSYLGFGGRPPKKSGKDPHSPRQTRWADLVVSKRARAITLDRF